MWPASEQYTVPRSIHITQQEPPEKINPRCAYFSNCCTKVSKFFANVLRSAFYLPLYSKSQPIHQTMDEEGSTQFVQALRSKLG